MVRVARILVRLYYFDLHNSNCFNPAKFQKKSQKKKKYTQAKLQLPFGLNKRMPLILRIYLNCDLKVLVGICESLLFTNPPVPTDIMGLSDVHDTCIV